MCSALPERPGQKSRHHRLRSLQGRFLPAIIPGMTRAEHAATEFILQTGTDYRVVWVSSGVRDVLGLSPDTLVGRRVNALGPQTHCGRSNFRLYRRVLEHGSAVIARDRVFAGDGLVTWVEIHAGPARDAAGRITGLMASVHRATAGIGEADPLSQRRAGFDRLTDLAQRPDLLAYLERVCGLQQGAGCGQVVIFINLDRFNAVNAAFGRHAGDDVLRAVALRLQQSLRDTDHIVARWGGDEMVVVLQGVEDFRHAMEAAEKLRVAVAPPVTTCAGPVEATVSIGLAVGRPGESADQLIARAVGAMAIAKQRGRNRVVAADGEKVAPTANLPVAKP